MNTWKELQPYLSDINYLNTIYKALMDMTPKDEINILNDVAPKNREKFIKIGCLFILEGNSDYYFSEYYTSIKRYTDKPCDFIERIKKKENELDKTKKRNI
jgi:hypothetical protein